MTKTQIIHDIREILNAADPKGPTYEALHDLENKIAMDGD
jgi:hypothetical protein